MKNIQRWGLMRKLIPENIQEHSLQVAAVAHMLGVIRNRRFHGDVDLGRLVILAMYHDCSEILTSDLPTPIKLLTPEFEESFKEVDTLMAMRLYATLPEDLRDEFEWILLDDECNAELHTLLKAADLICSYYKCIEELKLGNNDFENAKGPIIAALEELNLPEVTDFFEEFGRDLTFPMSNI